MGVGGKYLHSTHLHEIRNSGIQTLTAILPLSEAVASHVAPGMHLHFASTPSRSNAAVREVARVFKNSNPKFEISSSGFHSMLHVLPRLGLGVKYRACFFGDNYPVPRPNGLYQAIFDASEATLEVWSLLSYVESLRAGAMGYPFATTRSLRGSDMATDLGNAGAYIEVAMPTRDGGSETHGMVRGIRPDIAFVHGLLGDRHGNIVFSQPTSESFWSTVAARVGVIATVERIVEPCELAAFRDSMPVPRHNVLSISEEPRGAHPQPLFAAPRFGVEGYQDDLDHYVYWRKLATDDAAFAAFCEDVLEAEDGRRGYEIFCSRVARERACATTKKERPFSANAEALIVLAARTIYQRVREGGFRIIIAGIGNSFFASKLAMQWLEAEGVVVDVIVETGMVGIACGADGHPFLLSYENMGRAARVTNAENALGTLTCGADNRCLGVVGAGQIDKDGNVNSTVLQDGTFLVGSGGANDIASCSEEVIVLTRCDSARLVQQVDYITSPGTLVRTIVTERCTFHKDETAGWCLGAIYPMTEEESEVSAIAAVKEQCPWPIRTSRAMKYTHAVTDDERARLAVLDPARSQQQATGKTS